MKYVILLFMFLSVSVYAQLDSLDRIELNNGKVISGKIIKITTQTVDFRESMTNLLYEYQKSEIKNLKLSNGTIISFNESGNQQGNVTGSMQNTNPPSSSGTAGSNVTSSGTNTNTTTSGTTTDNTGSQRTDTNKQGQQQTSNTQQQNGTQQQQQGLSTTALVLLGAAGVIVLLLLGKAIF